LIKLGLVEDSSPKIYSAQAAGCNPVVEAIRAGRELIKPQKPKTIAKSIAIGNPADGFYVVQAIKQSGGWGEDATDDEIVDAIKLLAQTEGIWTEPAGGTTLAATIKLIKSGRIPRDESICVGITGNGLKTTEVVVDHLEPPASIPAKLEAFDAIVSGQAKTVPAPVPVGV
jgi:threonine synthase